MNVRLVKWIGLTALVLGITVGASAQQQQQYHQLTASDFAGVPRSNARGVVAYTNCTIDFKYQVTRRNGGFVLNALVQLLLNSNKSWLDRSRVSTQQQLTEILTHEQGHYTIAYLEQQELLRNINKTRFTRNYQYEAMAIFNRIDAKYKQLNTDYDNDSEHMTNRVQQNSWNLYFQKMLQFMPDLED
jgi:hypothetical protein